MREFRLLKPLAEGLVLIRTIEHNVPDDTIWSRGKVRIHRNCEISGKDLYGLLAYRPCGNQMYRSARINADIIDKEVMNMGVKKTDIAQKAKASRKKERKRQKKLGQRSQPNRIAQALPPQKVDGER
jgi:hypothetical protein